MCGYLIGEKNLETLVVERMAALHGGKVTGVNQLGAGHAVSVLSDCIVAAHLWWMCGKCRKGGGECK